MLTLSLVREKALSLGFDMIGIAPVLSEGTAPGAPAFLDWLAAGHHGEMGWLERPDAVDKRLHPEKLLPGVRSAVMVGLSYETLAVPVSALQDPARGRIARYAWGADYHDVITPVLRGFGDWLARESRAYVDTGPLLERGWAARAGLGFVGKNTCLIAPGRGSYFFLGAVLIADEILDDTTAAPTRKCASCGTCTRCLSACPTAAFPAPGVLDARKCISYLTIELKGDIPLALRRQLGNWVFGCDICQDVCPYVRRFSRAAKSPLARAFAPLDIERAAPRLLDLLQLSPEAFKQRFAGTPLLRAKWRGLLRNACVAAGNWGHPAAANALDTLTRSDDILVRSHALWALRKIVTI